MVGGGEMVGSDDHVCAFNAAHVGRWTSGMKSRSSSSDSSHAVQVEAHVFKRMLVRWVGYFLYLGIP